MAAGDLTRMVGEDIVKVHKTIDEMQDRIQPVVTMNENVRNMKVNIEEAAFSMREVVERIQSAEELITKLNQRSANLNQDYALVCDSLQKSKEYEIELDDVNSQIYYYKNRIALIETLEKAKTGAV